MSPDGAYQSTGDGSDGIFVPVVGPSGVGKDSLISYARERLSDRREFVFVRRIITRPVDPSSEDHDSVNEADFEALVRGDQLALWWHAHGLRYGLPKSLDSEIDNGRVVIANVSRHTLRQIRGRFPRVCVIAVSAHPEVIAARLAARGREDAHSIGQRQNRIVVEEFSDTDTVRIENSGPLMVAGERLVGVLRETAHPESWPQHFRLAGR